ncbi:MAG TPA: DUF5615 family PIN-like protein [Chloroflexota bacterium]|nr:DUF5615 family PIN-like protein [Chloroflexota bacterium]
MRVLIDECLPRRLKQHLPGHQVATVPEMGWAGTENGPLLRLAQEQFDVFVTVDQNLRFQQNVRRLRLGVVMLVAPSNRLDALVPLIPDPLDALAAVRPGTVIRVGVSDRA